MTNLPPEPGGSTPRDDIPNDPVSQAHQPGQAGDYYFGAPDSEAGVQRTLEIDDGDTFVTDEDLQEDTGGEQVDRDLAREVRRAGLNNPAVAVPTEEQVLDFLDDDGDDGEDPVPVPVS